MCGICGIVDDGRLAAPDKGRLVAGMMDDMAHRGPDDRGLVAEKYHAIGNVRLSIVDLQNGHQPMTNEDDSYWIVFNGEIFNYPELMQLLSGRGHVFRSTCDTEVLLHLFEEYGESCVDYLNGQFAFAIWDKSRRRLFGARDRLGIRPLYYHTSPGRFMFSSRILSLFNTGLIERSMDWSAVQDVLTFWVTLPGETIFTGVGEIPPGHFFYWTADRGLTMKSYWDINFPAEDSFGPGHEARPGKIAERFIELLEDAVRLRLRADVPVGAYLSGGIDSSVIASLVQRIHPHRLHTFSIGFEGHSFDERPYQDIMVKILDSEHHQIIPTIGELADAFPTVVNHAENILLRTAPVPMYFLSSLVRDTGFKVVLTGEGADEFLAGYNLFKENKVRRFWARNPDSRARSLLLTRIYPYLNDDRSKVGGFWRKFFSQGLTQLDDPFYSHRIRWNESATIRRFLSDEFTPGEWDGEARLARVLPTAFKSWHPLNQAQYLEARLFMPNYLLSSQGDRMMMANSVEGRFPFLDYRLVEFLNGIHPALKMNVLDEKYILKYAFRDRLPEAILKRDKQPYRAPGIASALAATGNSHVDTYLEPERVREAGVFKPEAVEGLLNKIRRLNGNLSGNRDTMTYLAILSTQILHQSFIHHSGVLPSPESRTQNYLVQER